MARISHYNLSCIPSDVVREYPSLPNARLLTTTLNQTEISIVEGDYFKTHKWITVPASGTVYVLFTAPPAGVLFALKSREIVSERSNVEYRTETPQRVRGRPTLNVAGG